jgi:hypothetical protein
MHKEKIELKLPAKEFRRLKSIRNSIKRRYRTVKDDSIDNEMPNEEKSSSSDDEKK